MADQDFRAITLFYAADSELWSNFMQKQFKAEKIKIRMDTVNLSMLEYSSPPEVQVAIKESHVILLLITDGLLSYMEMQADWFARMLESRDCVLTSVFAVRLCADYEDLMEVGAKFNYDLHSWEDFELDSAGSNAKSLVDRVLIHVDSNVYKLIRKRKMREKRANAGVQVVPESAGQVGEKAALMFNEELKGQITVHVEDSSSEALTVTKVNPYCVTFVTPELELGGYTQLIIKENGVVRWEVPWSCHVQSCSYSSLDLLQQAYGANSCRDLDLILTQKFKQSECSDINFLTEHLRDNVTLEAGKTLYPSMLHWAAAHGLKELVAAILFTPAGSSLGRVTNSQGQEPASMARSQGHSELGDFINDTLEMEAMAEAYSLYVQRGNGNLTEEPQEEELYEDVENEPTKPVPPPIPKRRTPSKSDSSQESQYITPDEPTSETLYLEPEELLPPGAGGSRFQGNLITIQKEVKSGQFTIPEAEMLVNALKEGRNKSYKEKMASLNALRAEYKPTLSAIREICHFTPHGLAASMTQVISPLKEGDPLSPSGNRDSKASQMSSTSVDSGFAASEDARQGARPVSSRDLYIQLVNSTSPDDLDPGPAPPALPPRPAKKPSKVYTRAASTLPAKVTPPKTPDKPK